MADAKADTAEPGMSYEALAKEKGGMRFTVSDMPPIPLTILMGFQHYLTMLGATVLIPILLVGEMGGTPVDTANVISTILFVSGLNTLIQTSIGGRLPIVQGGSFAFLGPVFGTIYNPEMQAIADPEERFKTTMRTVQGAIFVCGLIQIVLGYSGVMSFILRFISPLTIAPTVCAIGLGLYGVGFSGVGGCMAVGLPQIVIVVLFSQCCGRIQIPIPGFGPLPIFKLFPVLLGIIVIWLYALILTSAGVWEAPSPCRTDGSTVIADAPWFRFPYPFQWGVLRFKAYAIIPMIGAMLASMVESVGDYYAAAKMSGAPPPTGAIISRGLASEGIGLICSGLWGTGNGTTSYGENIGALAVTKVGSRVVVQTGAIIMLVLSLFGKFGAIFASMPGPMVSALYCCLFGLIAAVGLSNLQHTDMNSSRNLFILGFALYNSLSVAGPGGYFATYTGADGGDNPFGQGDWAAVGKSFFNNPMIIAFLCAMILDNLVPGTREERGLHVWDMVKGKNVLNDPEYAKVYMLPLGMGKLVRHFAYLDRIESGSWPEATHDGASVGDLHQLCCPCCPCSKVPAQDGAEEAGAGEAAASSARQETEV